MYISVKSDYALLAIFDLAAQRPGEPIRIADIASPIPAGLVSGAAAPSAPAVMLPDNKKSPLGLRGKTFLHALSSRLNGLGEAIGAAVRKLPKPIAIPRRVRPWRS